MHNDQFGNQSAKSETQADKEWSEFERDLDTLGRQLAALQVHTASLGTHLVSSLEARFDEVRARALSFKQAREAELEQVRRTAHSQAESTFSDARTRSTSVFASTGTTEIKKLVGSVSGSRPISSQRCANTETLRANTSGGQMMLT